MEERIFSTQYGDIHYWINIIDKKQPTLVCLPGLTADHRLFSKQTEYFEGKYNYFVWDAPGHFMSRPFKLEFHLEDKAKWLDEILTKEEIEFPVIVGQSMGGYVGQMYSQLFPEKLKGFVVIDSAPLQKKYMTGIEIWMLEHVEGIYRAYPWKSLLKAGSKGVASTEYGRQNMLEMMESYGDNPKEYCHLVGHGYKILAEAIRANLPYEIKCPVQLICGEEDKAGSAKSYNKKWHETTGMPINWIKGAGHNSNADKPEEINQIIEDLLNSI